MASAADIAAPPSRHKLSVTDFHRMAEAGILREDDRVELIEGELIDMAPIGSRHMGTVIQLMRLLQSAVGDAALVSVQNPVRIDAHSEPQPDVALLLPRDDLYRSALPTARDVLLVIEVADTSTDYDRHVKLPLYARHGISEAWLVDLQQRVVEVHRDPQADGYRSQRPSTAGETLTVERLPQVRISASDVLD